SVGASRQSKSVSEGFIGAAGTILTGSDHAATTTIDEAVESALAAKAIGNKVLGSFFSVSAANIRYDSGSHVDVHSFAASVGASYGIDLNPGRVTLGLFLEFGYGDYDAYNSFPGVGVVLGSGHTSYVGGGLLARYDFAQSASGNFYAELTARFGQVQNDYSSDDLLPANQRVTYDSATPYFGLHFGLGYKWNVSPAGVLHVYGKYLWNHINGDDVILSSGDRVNFSAVNSHRLQVGVRYTHAVNEYFSPYVGVGFEYEFDGRAKATTFGLPIEAPSLRGATGMGEIGFKFTPKPQSPFSVDFGVKGYVGKRRGVSGNIMIRIDF
ncbi:MAG: autotransporter outer membrane beta-barrel domain-containing protein, partial [Deltaproteobacteria bacterium]|nr:autotransporter outer membrane beta-barrel domain-containing protein [Deltaproteobacteria bacterium]